MKTTQIAFARVNSLTEDEIAEILALLSMPERSDLSFRVDNKGYVRRRSRGGPMIGKAVLVREIIFGIIGAGIQEGGASPGANTDAPQGVEQMLPIKEPHFDVGDYCAPVAKEGLSQEGKEDVLRGGIIDAPSVTEQMLPAVWSNIEDVYIGAPEGKVAPSHGVGSPKELAVGPTEKVEARLTESAIQSGSKFAPNTKSTVEFAFCATSDHEHHLSEMMVPGLLAMHSSHRVSASIVDPPTQRGSKIAPAFNNESNVARLWKDSRALRKPLIKCSSASCKRRMRLSSDVRPASFRNRLSQYPSAARSSGSQTPSYPFTKACCLSKIARLPPKVSYTGGSSRSPILPDMRSSELLILSNRNVSKSRNE